MRLFEFTTETDETGGRIVRASGCIADHPDPEQRKVWLAFQVETDMRTARSGAIQRRAALEQARELLDEQVERLRHIEHQVRS